MKKMNMKNTKTTKYLAVGTKKGNKFAAVEQFDLDEFFAERIKIIKLVHTKSQNRLNVKWFHKLLNTSKYKSYIRDNFIVEGEVKALRLLNHSLNWIAEIDLLNKQYKKQTKVTTTKKTTKKKVAKKK